MFTYSAILTEASQAFFNSRIMEGLFTCHSDSLLTVHGLPTTLRAPGGQVTTVSLAPSPASGQSRAWQIKIR